MDAAPRNTVTEPEAEARAQSPLSPAERIEALDVLRGFALFGIFIMNMPGFTHSMFAAPVPSEGGLDAAVVFVREALFAGKFNLLFGTLFGVGFTLQLARLEATRPGRAAGTYVRRLLVLLAIGLIHAALLWSGDVLVIYAVLGFALLALHRWPQRRVLAALLVCLFLPALVEAARPWLFSVRVETVAAFEYQDFEASNDAAFGHGSFLGAVRETARVFAWNYSSPLGLYSVATFYVQMATGVLLGLYIGKRNWASRLPSLAAPIARLQWLALAVAIVGGTVAVWLGRDADAGIDVGLATFPAALARTLGRLALMIFYATSLLRLIAAGRLRGWLRPLALAGRMPLSNYLLQTLMGTFAFYGWGLGAWGRASALDETLLAVTLYAVVQLPLSAWWLGRFRYGPVEWLWRRLTYGRL